MRKVRLFDGTLLSFPDDTPDSVIDEVAQRETIARNPALKVDESTLDAMDARAKSGGTSTAISDQNRRDSIRATESPDLMSAGGMLLDEEDLAAPPPRGPKRPEGAGVMWEMAQQPGYVDPMSVGAPIVRPSYTPEETGAFGKGGEEPAWPTTVSRRSFADASRGQRSLEEGLRLMQEGQPTGEAKPLSGVDAASVGAGRAAGVVEEAGDTWMAVTRSIPQLAALTADVAQLLTAGNVGKDFGNFMRQIDEDMARDQSSEHRGKATQLGELTEQGDMVGAAAFLLSNPKFLIDTAIPSAATMIPAVGSGVGAAALVGRLARASKLLKSMTPAQMAALESAAATGGSNLANILMNAGSTYAETGSYESAATAAVFTAIAARLTGGGAEGQLARAASGGRIPAGLRSALTSGGRSGLTEFGQESIESVGQGIGTQTQQEVFNPMQVGTQAVVEGMMGAVIGGAAGVFQYKPDPVQKRRDEFTDAQNRDRQSDAGFNSQLMGSKTFDDAIAAAAASVSRPREAAKTFAAQIANPIIPKSPEQQMAEQYAAAGLEAPPVQLPQGLMSNTFGTPQWEGTPTQVPPIQDVNVVGLTVDGQPIIDDKPWLRTPDGKFASPEAIAQPAPDVGTPTAPQAGVGVQPPAVTETPPPTGGVSVTPPVQQDFGGELSTDKTKELAGRVRRFASGMSRVGDMAAGSYATMDQASNGIGVDVGELSKPGIKNLASAVLNRTSVFVDSGAFSAFTRGVKTGKFEPVDFDEVLARYDELLNEIYEQNEVQDTDYPRPVFVMPDQVGDQAASIELVRKYKDWIGTEAWANQSRVVIPIQKGKLSMAEAYRQVVNILGSDNFIVGIPSNEAAVSPAELTQFLKEVQPKAIHILGAAADKNLLPRLQSVVDAGLADTMEVTSDATLIRSKIVQAVAEGKTRWEATFDTLYEGDLASEKEDTKKAAAERREAERKKLAEQKKAAEEAKKKTEEETGKGKLPPVQQGLLDEEIRLQEKFPSREGIEDGLRDLPTGEGELQAIVDWYYDQKVRQAEVAFQSLMATIGRVWEKGLSPKQMLEARQTEPKPYNEPKLWILHWWDKTHPRSSQLTQEESIERVRRRVKGHSDRLDLKVEGNSLALIDTETGNELARERISDTGIYPDIDDEARAFGQKNPAGRAPKTPAEEKSGRQKLARQALRTAAEKVRRAAEEEAQPGVKSALDDLAKQLDSFANRIGSTALKPTPPGWAMEQSANIDKLIELARKDPTSSKLILTPPRTETAEEKKAREKAEAEAKKTPEQRTEEWVQQAKKKENRPERLKTQEALQAEVFDAVKVDPQVVEAARARRMSDVEKAVAAYLKDQADATTNVSDLKGAFRKLAVEALYDAKSDKATLPKKFYKNLMEEVIPPKDKGKKLENTGADLRRWFDKLKADAAANKSSVEKTWDAISKATIRANLVSKLIPFDAKTNFIGYMNEMRDSIVPFKEWLFEHHNWTSSGWSDDPDLKQALEGNRYPFGEKFISDEDKEKYKTDPDFRANWLSDKASEYLDQVRTLIDALQGQTTIEGMSAAYEKAMFTKVNVGTFSDGSSDVRHYGHELTELGTKLSSRPKIADANSRLTSKSQFVSQLIAAGDTYKLPEREKPLIPPRIENPIRKGLTDYTSGIDITPERMKREMGFADVGFGSWVLVGRDQAHLNSGYVAFRDMALLWGMPTEGVGFGGQMHFTIGALGHGKFAAHFSPNQPHPDGGTVPVINLTNTNGDGTVAHEWGHALDQFLRWDKQGKYIDEILDLLKRTYDIEAYESRIRAHLFAGASGPYFTRGGRKIKQSAIQNARMSADHYARDGNIPATGYKKHADVIGEDYWGNDRELFARAVEAWAVDKLNGQQQLSQYLVNHVWVGFGSDDGATRRGLRAYPQGDERRLFNQAIEALAKSIEWKDGKPTVNDSKWQESKPKAKDDWTKRVEWIRKNFDAYVAEIQAAEDAKNAEEEQKQRELEEQKARETLAALEAQKRAEREASGELTDEDIDAIFDEAVAEAKEATAEEPNAPTPGQPVLEPAVRKWTREDLDYLLSKIEPGVGVAVSDNEGLPGVPTIHDLAKLGNTNHAGMGVFVTTGQDWKMNWDGGGAMQHTPNGHAFTTVQIEGPAPYDSDAVREALAGKKRGAGPAGQPKELPPSLDSQSSKTGAELAKEAAKLGVEGVQEALTGLAKLFGGGPGRLSSFPGGLDAEAYKQAKPHFDLAWKRFQEAGKTLKAMADFLFKAYGEGIKPYFRQWVKDLQSAQKDVRTASTKIADWVYGQIGAESTFTTPHLLKQADDAYGGTLAEGKYSIKDAYDAMEAGVNRWIIANNEYFTAQQPASSAATTMDTLRQITSRLPTQTSRTSEMDAMQQFSTPPEFAFVANWVADVNENDVMAETSAGVGGIASFAKASGAKLVLNELSDRRLAILKEVFPEEVVFNENAEILYNILPENIRPTVVVINPPFSAKASGAGKTTMVGAVHVEQALKMLAPGGRLVAIVGEGMAMDRPAFKEWWGRIQKEYAVRVNVGVSGKGYAKYGTTFDNQLLVIDKIAPDGQAVVTGNVEKYVDLLPLLEGVRNARPAAERVPGLGDRAPQLDRPVQEPRTPAGGETERQPDSGRGAADGGRGSGVEGGAGTGAGTGEPATGLPEKGVRSPGKGGRGGRSPAGGNAGPGRGEGNTAGEGGGPSSVESEIEVEAGEAAKAGELTDSVFDNYTPSKVKVEGARPHPGKLVESAAMASVMPPNPTYTPNLPKKTVEGFATDSKKPNVKDGGLSLPQLEVVVYTGQAHSQFLSNGERRGFFIGDGTGVGKGREISAIILDNIRQGRKKAVWVSKSQDLINDAKRDFQGAGGDPSVLFNQNATTFGEKIKAKDGVLFTTYATMRMGGASSSKSKAAKWNPEKELGVGKEVFVEVAKSTPTGYTTETVGGAVVDISKYSYGRNKGKIRSFEYRGADGVVRYASPAEISLERTAEHYAFQKALQQGKDPFKATAKPTSRVDQIVEWLGEDFDGVIAFDEAHSAKNAISLQAGAGTKGTTASQAGLSVVDLQKKLPKARIVYVSATGAAEVSNLSFATRLGIWGQGTSFASPQDFIAKIDRAGLAAMEMIARDLKLMGVYQARSLSYEDVTYEDPPLVHELDGLQRDMYNRLSEAWRVILDNIDKAIESTSPQTSGDEVRKNAKKRRSDTRAQLYGAQLRFYDQVLTSFAMPSILERAQQALDNGEAVVMQLINTYEASLKREMDKAADSDNPDDVGQMDLTPREVLINFLNKFFPVLQYVEEADPLTGTINVVPAKDSQGNPVVNKEAEAMRDAMIKDIKEMPVPASPIDQVVAHFGVDKVAEVTGRQFRPVETRNPDGSTSLTIEKRAGNSNTAEAADFMADKKKILIFSDAGGTGFSFHADKTKQNQRRRTHMIIQPGWSAMACVQAFGRTHRTNQANAPHYILCATDVPAQRRFVTSVARRLSQLGALTKGQRGTTGGTFSEKDNLESRYAEQAITSLFNDLQRGTLQGFNRDDLLKQMGLSDIVNATTNQIVDTKLPSVTQFLNRLLALSLDHQSQLFDEFILRMEANVEQSIIDGTYDAGMQTIKAESTRVILEETINVDERTGAETKYFELELTHKTKLTKFPDQIKVTWYTNNKTKRIWGVVRSGNTTLDSGRVIPRFRMVGTNGIVYRTADEFKPGDNFTEVTQDEARTLWDEENAKKPQTYTTREHLIVGLLLPIWDRLPEQNIQVVRTQTDTGNRVIGRVIRDKDLQDVLANFNIKSSTARKPSSEIMAEVIGGAEGILANGWILKRSLVKGDLRIELLPGKNKTSQFSMSQREQLRNNGLIEERIDWNYRFFIPVGKEGEPILTKVMENRPLVSIGKKEDGEVSKMKGERTAALMEPGDVEGAKESLAAEFGRKTAEALMAKGESNRPGGLILRGTTDELIDAYRDKNGFREDHQSVQFLRNEVDTTLGFYDHDTQLSFVVAGPDAGTYLRSSVLHEIGVHAWQLLEPAKASVLNERAVELINSGEDEIAREARGRMRRVGELTDDGVIINRHEAWAYLASAAQEATEGNRPIPRRIADWMRDMIAAIRAAFYKMGVFIKASDLTTRDLVAIARSNLKAVALSSGVDKYALFDGVEEPRQAKRVYGDVPQAVDSAATSRKQVPAAMKLIPWKSGTVNLDLGAGRFGDATEFLDGRGVENIQFDPFNRTDDENFDAIEGIAGNGGVDTVTVLNVLNVIPEESARDNVVRRAAKAVKADGVAYFQTYEGDGSGVGTRTRDGWQENRKTPTYESEIKKHFGDVRRRGQVIEARQPKKRSGESWKAPEGGILFARRDPVLKEAMRKAGVPEDDRTFGARVVDRMSQVRDAFRWAFSGDRIAQSWFDQFHGIKMAERTIGNLPAEQSGYVAARFSTGVPAIMNAMLTEGAPEWRDGIIQKVAGSRGLLEIFEPVQDEFNEWIGWMVGKRAEFLSTQGKERNLTGPEIAKLISLGNGKEAVFEAVAKEFAAYKRQVLDVAEEAGLIDGTTRPAWDRADWIPFYRALEERVTGPGNTRGLSHQSSKIRRLTGSKAVINDPLENILMNFAHLMDASLKNHALRMTVDNVEQTGLIERKRLDIRPALVPNSEIRRALLEGGVDEATVDAMPPDVFEGIRRMWSVQAPTDKDVVRVMRNGKAEYWRVLDRPLLRSLTSINADAYGPAVRAVVKPMRAFKRALTRGVTATPDFMLRNFIRDTTHAQIITKDRMIPFLDGMKGAARSYAEKGGGLDMMFAGASFLGGHVSANDPEALAEATRRALRSQGWNASAINEFLSTIVDTPTKLWEKWEEVGNAIENANREAVYEAAIKTGKSKAQALFESKDLMDYSMRGDWAIVQFMSDVLPFFNARMQGLYKLARASHDPNARLKIAQHVMVRGGLLMLGTLALLAANDGEDWYEELPEWDRDTYWHFRIKTGAGAASTVGESKYVEGKGQYVRIRIPKPFEIGVVFGTIPERIFRRLKGTDDTGLMVKRIGWNIYEQLAMNPIPQFARPILEVYANRSMFTGSPIESERQTGKLPSTRYDERTSATTRALADMAPDLSDALGVSPKVAEYLVRGYLGELGAYALGMTDMVVRMIRDEPTRPGLRSDEIPLIKSFVRADPPFGTRWKDELYQMHNEVERIYKSVRELRKEGKDARADKMIERNEEKLDTRRQLSRTTERIRELGIAADEIRKDRTLSRQEKRDQLDEILAEQNAIAAETAKETRKAFR